MGFADEVIKSAANWKNLFEPPAPKQVFSMFRQLSGSAAAAAQPTDEPKKGYKTMKTLIGLLARIKMLPTADMTDEAAIVNAVEGNFKTLSGVSDENVTLKNRVKAFEDAQKIRITAKIDKAVENKLVKPERKETLVAMGLRDEAELDNYLADIETVRAESQATTQNQQQNPPARRGAPPVPKKEGTEEETTETKIVNLQEKLKTASPSDSMVICRELRELRGHKDILGAK